MSSNNFVTPYESYLSAILHKILGLIEHLSLNTNYLIAFHTYIKPTLLIIIMTALCLVIALINAKALNEDLLDGYVSISPLNKDGRLSLENGAFVITTSSNASTTASSIDKVQIKKNGSSYHIFVDNVQICYSRQANTPIACKSEDAKGAEWEFVEKKDGTYSIKSKKTKGFWKGDMCLAFEGKLEVKDCKDDEPFKFMIKKYEPRVAPKENLKPVPIKDLSDPKELIDVDDYDTKESKSVDPDSKTDVSTLDETDEDSTAGESSSSSSSSSSKDSGESGEKPNVKKGINVKCDDKDNCKTEYDENGGPDIDDTDSEASACESSSEQEESPVISEKLKQFLESITCHKQIAPDSISLDKLKLVCEDKKKPGVSQNNMKNGKKPTNNQEQYYPIDNPQITTLGTQETIPNLQNSPSATSQSVITQRNACLVPKSQLVYPSKNITNQKPQDNDVQACKPTHLEPMKTDKDLDNDMCEDITSKIDQNYNVGMAVPSDSFLEDIQKNSDQKLTKKQIIKYLCKLGNKFNQECNENIEAKKKLLDKLCKAKGELIRIKTTPRALSDLSITINPFENFPKEIAKTFDDANQIISKNEDSKLDDARKSFEKTYKDLINEIKRENRIKPQPSDTYLIKDNNGNVISQQKRVTYKNRLTQVLDFLRNIRKKDAAKKACQ